MSDDVQNEVAALWKQATSENLPEIGDLEGYSNDFFNLFGFKVEGVDYDAEVDEMVTLPSEA
jgi:enoyl-[acyl-carrier protein] reductase/trans-2-enoyl-CoA reductase (NAD+)